MNCKSPVAKNLKAMDKRSWVGIAFLKLVSFFVILGITMFSNSLNWEGDILKKFLKSPLHLYSRFIILVSSDIKSDKRWLVV